LRFQLDVCDTAQIQDVVGRVWQMLGRIDVLFNVAGTMARKPAVGVTEADYRVDAIAPGFVLTDLNRAFLESGAQGRI
jgi:NAD(P)-dependent dehydrogenase (short-subunit alcohol dehydrogenase family)